MWWKEAVIYEVYVDKFAKNFKGMAEKLPYLKNLGINTIWLLPHYPSPMVDDGYDVSDYYGVRQDLGTIDDFKAFAVASHEAGMRVIIDLVLNHVSVEHPWFQDACRSESGSKRNYFLWSKTGTDLGGANSPFNHFVPNHWTFNPATNDYYFSTFYSQQADLNWDNPEVYNEILKIIDFWSGLGVDGFRLDAISHLIKRENTDSYHLPEIHPILKKMRRHIDEMHPGVILLAEACGALETARSYFGDGDECQIVFHFPLMSNIYLALKRNDMSLIDDIVKRSFNIPENCQWATFLTNHDEISFAPFEQPERDEMVNWLDSESKYSFPGGSGVSMRLGTIFKGDKEKILNLAKILFNLPGSPVLYYGSEIGMKNLGYVGEHESPTYVRGYFEWATQNLFKIIPGMHPALNVENLQLIQKPIDSRKYVRGDFDWQEAGRQEKDSNSLLNLIAQLIKKRIRS